MRSRGSTSRQASCPLWTSVALRRLVAGNLADLDAPLLPGQANGLDQLALHEAAQGRVEMAVAVQLQGDLTGVQGARRLARAAQWLDADQVEQFEQADQLLETALDQAAAAEAWGLAMELLRQQLQLHLAAGVEGERPRQRMERLAAVLDDRYVLQQLHPEKAPDPLLRSPREPGGHADVRPTAVAPSP